MNKHLKRLITVVLIILIIGIFVIKINNPNRERYPVRGVDVSSYQGDIDWELLASQDIQFAFIKATEGSSYVDPYFEKNYSSAIKTNLRIGAYHFFSFESSGKTQAENFCEKVSYTDSMLPPVLDVEYYGSYSSLSGAELENVRSELRICIDEIEKHFGITPVIYATQKSKNEIIGDEFSDCDLWIRSVYLRVSDNMNWSFWQYSDRQKLDGYNGEEKYIDMNVFNGNLEEFRQYGAEK